MENQVKVLELFAGIGACSKALKKAGISIEIVDAVEIDKYAMASFNAIHDTNFEVQDITTYNKNYTNIDLITHGSPCQDFSVAGKQAGGDLGSGTRSSLMYETIRIVGQIQPKYVLWENVKNILSNKHRHNFESYIETMNILGYNSYYEVLNAKDYGIPQNRERVYTVSIRKDIDEKNFEFPKKEKLELKLKNLLEKEVDEKYFLSSKQIEIFLKNRNGNFNPSCKGVKVQVQRIGGIFDSENSKHQAGSIYDPNGISPVLTNMQGGLRQPCIEVKNATKKGYDEAIEGDSINLQYPNSTTRRGRVGHQVAQTLMANDNIGVFEKYRIRKLTPKECWRLMGFDDEDFEKAKNLPTSNTQLYKQAGNSIVVNVLEKIFLNLFRS